MAIVHTYKTKDGHETRKLTKAKAIRKYCLMCGGWSYKEVDVCPVKDCPLYPFRFGNEKGLIDPEDRKKTKGIIKKKKLKRKILKRIKR